MLDLQIKTTKETKGGNTFTYFFANGIKVATMRTYSDWFCTVKKGQRSTTRDKVKIAREFEWNLAGLIELTKIEDITIGGKFFSSNRDFYDQYSDTSWGTVPSAVSKDQVKETINEFISKRK